MLKVLTNYRGQIKVSSMFIEGTKYTFVVLFNFSVEPISEYLTRVEIEKTIAAKYYPETKIKPLFVKINPAVMAMKDSKNNDELA